MALHNLGNKSQAAQEPVDPDAGDPIVQDGGKKQ